MRSSFCRNFTLESNCSLFSRPCKAALFDSKDCRRPWISSSNRVRSSSRALFFSASRRICSRISCSRSFSFSTKRSRSSSNWRILSSSFCCFSSSRCSRSAKRRFSISSLTRRMLSPLLSGSLSAAARYSTSSSSIRLISFSSLSTVSSAKLRSESRSSARVLDSFKSSSRSIIRRSFSRSTASSFSSSIRSSRVSFNALVNSIRDSASSFAVLEKSFRSFRCSSCNSSSFWRFSDNFFCRIAVSDLCASISLVRDKISDLPSCTTPRSLFFSFVVSIHSVLYRSHLAWSSWIFSSLVFFGLLASVSFVKVVPSDLKSAESSESFRSSTAVPGKPDN
mmetsp:Transcript_125040/g.350175  ORF Transcript_125040/g.350175 Transcript_125040/m.350175 type:complete len:337 (+) Transcript_125040:859-1869(+)